MYTYTQKLKFSDETELEFLHCFIQNRKSHNFVSQHYAECFLPAN